MTANFYLQPKILVMSVFFFLFFWYIRTTARHIRVFFRFTSLLPFFCTQMQAAGAASESFLLSQIPFLPPIQLFFLRIYLAFYIASVVANIPLFISFLVQIWFYPHPQVLASSDFFICPKLPLFFAFISIFADRCFFIASTHHSSCLRASVFPLSIRLNCSSAAYTMCLMIFLNCHSQYHFIHSF